MKNIVIIMIAMAGLSLSAQPGDRGNQMERLLMLQKMKDYTPEQVAELKTKEMTLQLDLSEAQQTEIQKIHLELAQKRDEMKENRPDPEKITSEELFEAQISKLEEQIRVKRQFQTILNEEQFAKFEKISVRKEQMRRQGPRRGKRK